MAVVDRFKFQYSRDNANSINYHECAFDAVLYDQQGPVVYLRMNQDQNRNAINERLSYDLCAGLHRANDDPSVRVVVITSTGKSFGSGFDLSSPPGDELAPVPPELRPTVRDFFNIERRRCVKFEDYLYYPKPTNAQVHGFCVGAHEALQASCDFTIADEQAIFGRTGHGQLLWGIDHWPWFPHISERVRQNRLELEVTGKEAADLGLINKAVPRDQLDAEVARWAKALGEIPADAYLVAKEWLGACQDVGGRSAAFRSHYQAHLAIQWCRFDADEVNFYRVRRDKGLTGFFSHRLEHQVKVLKD